MAEDGSIRCAIYTRKSTEEGLEQGFNTLDAQREGGEAFIRSQQARGWMPIAERFDDGGYSGADMNRPGLQRLLGAVDSGQIDCVVVYKVDRLSRSLLDFARLMERLDRRGVSFVSVTQEFNTTTSIGRLTLNILLSFAQFEREIIGERTRDKLSAARRKGKWIGGWPVLGYDIKGGRLELNEAEAEQVRNIYRIAAQAPSLEAVVKICAARGYRTKQWVSRNGKTHASRPLARMTLRLLLSNVLYTGAVSHKGTLYPGEQERIVDQRIWEQVNSQMDVRGAGQRGKPHKPEPAHWTGVLFCRACGSPMRFTHTTRHGRRYHYYSCQTRRKVTACEQKPIQAEDLGECLRRALQPVLGAAVQCEQVHSSIERIECETRSRRVWIQFCDGTRSEHEIPQPSRPGIQAEVRPDVGRIARVSRLLALAIKLEGLVREGRVRSYSLLAQSGRVSRARLSQILQLTQLAPDIQEQILFLPATVAGPDRITEKALRRIAQSIDWQWQRDHFRECLK